MSTLLPESLETSFLIEVHVVARNTVKVAVVMDVVTNGSLSHGLWKEEVQLNTIAEHLTRSPCT